MSMGFRWLNTALPALLLASLTIPGLAFGDDDDDDDGEHRHRGGRRSFAAELDGFQQVPAFGTTGSGEVRIELSRKEEVAEYEVSYENLQGSLVLFVHLHFGRPGTNGGVISLLCSSAVPTPNVPPCPDASGGSVTGSLDASRVLGPIGQGMTPGDFQALARALRAGATYVNVHTNASTPGEVRGNLRTRR